MVHACITSYNVIEKSKTEKNSFLIKCKISAIGLVEIAWIFLILLIAKVQISMECETQEN